MLEVAFNEYFLVGAHAQMIKNRSIEPTDVLIWQLGVAGAEYNIYICAFHLLIQHLETYDELRTETISIFVDALEH